MNSSTPHADAGYEPRQGNISNAEVRYYIRRARNLRAQAFHDVGHALAQGLFGLWQRARQAGGGLRHSCLWRVPGSGNCLNC